MQRVLAAFLLALAAPIILVCAALVLLVDRQNPFFPARRMKSADAEFTMWKLRTMRGVDDGVPTGGNKSHRVTPLGHVLRRWSVDELPQLWNVVRGDMRLIGPRPPTQWAVFRNPKQFAEVLCAPPGLTGLATVVMAEEEERILAVAPTHEAVTEIYATKILPCKLEIERHYLRHRSLSLDIWILGETLRMILRKVLKHPGSAPTNFDRNEAQLQPGTRQF